LEDVEGTERDSMVTAVAPWVAKMSTANMCTKVRNPENLRLMSETVTDIIISVSNLMNSGNLQNEK
jgi:hypothetical protein